MQNKPKSVLEVEPSNELIFKGPFNQVVATHMKLVNPTEKKICFKVKTTAPRRYCVRPNNGILAPKSSVDIRIRLQPLDIPDSEKTKHKFMVQSLIVPEGHTNSVDELWKLATEHDIMYTKLRCSFEYPPGVKVSPESINRATCAPSMIRSTTIEEKESGAVEDEVRRLKVDVDNFQKENMKLQETIMRLTNMSGVPSRSDIVGSRGPPVTLYPGVIYILFALVTGYLIGKFII